MMKVRRVTTKNRNDPACPACPVECGAYSSGVGRHYRTGACPVGTEYRTGVECGAYSTGAKLIPPGSILSEKRISKCHGRPGFSRGDFVKERGA